MEKTKNAVQMCLSNELSIRKASLVYGIPYTNLQRAIHHARAGPVPPKGREVAFSLEEEQLLINMISEFGDLGKPLSRGDLLEVASLLIASLPLSRQKELNGRFKKGKPGRGWARCFLKRYKDKLTFKKSNKLEHCRNRARNADTLTRHFSKITGLIEKYKIDASRIFNLDESGCSPRDFAGNRVKVFGVRGGRNEKVDP